MEPNQTQEKPRTSAKDFFLNLGAIVALYVTVVSLINLLFTVINTAYPQITNGYYGSQSISFPVATLIIFFPIYILLMWVLEKGYRAEPLKKHIAVRKWLTYITLFIAGLTLASDLVAALYNFLDGQELTVGFIFKIIVVFVVALCVFLYYISDIRDRVNSKCRKIWLGVAVLIILASIVWGFAVLGSPHTQQLIKYDEQKINDLQNINNQVSTYYYQKNVLPANLAEVTSLNNYYGNFIDEQTKQPYEYNKISSTTYNVCAAFNKEGKDVVNRAYPATLKMYPPGYGNNWGDHPAGHYCFTEKAPANMYPGGKLPM